MEEKIDEEEGNGEWEKGLEEWGVGEKIGEMKEVEVEGGDVYMSRFGEVKS